MIRGFSRRGQPLTVLALVLGCWVSARVMMWDASAMPIAAHPLPMQAPVAIARAATPATNKTATPMAPAPVPEAAVAILPREVQSLGLAAHKFAAKLGAVAAYQPATGDPASSQAYRVEAYAPAAAPRPSGGLRMTRAIPAKFAQSALPRARGPIVFQQPHAASGWEQELTPQGNGRFPPGTWRPLCP